MLWTRPSPFSYINSFPYLFPQVQTTTSLPCCCVTHVNFPSPSSLSCHLTKSVGVTLGRNLRIIFFFHHRKRISRLKRAPGHHPGREDRPGLRRHQPQVSLGTPYILRGRERRQKGLLVEMSERRLRAWWRRCRTATVEGGSTCVDLVQPQRLQRGTFSRVATRRRTTTHTPGASSLFKSPSIIQAYYS